MPKLVIHQEKVEDPQVLVDICPFGAMEEKDGKLSINAACKMCRLCVKKGPAGAVEYVEDEKKEEIDKSQWNGIAVYVDHVDGEIHPVTYELIGKARELAVRSITQYMLYLWEITLKTKQKNYYITELIKYLFTIFQNWQDLRSNPIHPYLKISSRNISHAQSLLEQQLLEDS